MNIYCVTYDTNNLPEGKGGVLQFTAETLELGRNIAEGKLMQYLASSEPPISLHPSAVVSVVDHENLPPIYRVVSVSVADEEARKIQ